MKRLCSVLLIALLLAAALVPVSAAGSAGFTDQADIRNDSAVEMLVDLGLIAGYEDGSFRPNAFILRAEVAKLISMFNTDDPAGSGVYFTDTAGSWALDYIGYCAEKNIIGGDGLGHFRPADYVTAQELAKMLLVSLGEDASRYTGPGWAENVNVDAQAMGLYDGFSAACDRIITRDNACLLIYNAMKCWYVENPEETGLMRYALDDLMNPKTFLEVRYGVVRYTATLTGNECADLTSPGGKLDAGVTKLSGHKEFAVSTDLGLLGRSVDIYVRDGEIVGVPCYAAGEVYYTFSSREEMDRVFAGGGFTMSDDAKYYLNFDRTTADVVYRLTDNSRITVIDHTGDQCFDMMLVVSAAPAEVISLSPLTVHVNGTDLEVLPFSSADTFELGENVFYCDICGKGYIRAN